MGSWSLRPPFLEFWNLWRLWLFYLTFYWLFAVFWHSITQSNVWFDKQKKIRAHCLKINLEQKLAIRLRVLWRKYQKENQMKLKILQLSFKERSQLEGFWDFCFLAFVLNRQICPYWPNCTIIFDYSDFLPKYSFWLVGLSNNSCVWVWFLVCICRMLVCSLL